MLRRVPPDARQGKAAALNAAWRRLDELLLDRPLGRLAARPRDRLRRRRGRPPRPGAPAASPPRTSPTPASAASRCSSGSTTARRPLTWCQDVEFSVYGLLYQAGRTRYGAAGMGGNGQFNRLSALDAIADDDAGGPWRDRLTEDQDLGLRLLEAGWRGVGDARTTSTSRAARAPAAPAPADALGAGEPPGDGPPRSAWRGSTGRGSSDSTSSPTC